MGIDPKQIDLARSRWSGQKQPPFHSTSPQHITWGSNANNHKNYHTVTVRENSVNLVSFNESVQNLLKNMKTTK